MELTNLIFIALGLAAVTIISSLPLFFTARLFGGHVTMFKAVVVNIMGAVLVVAIEFFFPLWGGIIGVISILGVYKIAFDLPILKAVAVWLIQGLILVALVFLGSVLGIISGDILAKTQMIGAAILDI